MQKTSRREAGASQLIHRGSEARSPLLAVITQPSGERVARDHLIGHQPCQLVSCIAIHQHVDVFKPAPYQCRAIVLKGDAMAPASRRASFMAYSRLSSALNHRSPRACISSSSQRSSRGDRAGMAVVRCAKAGNQLAANAPEMGRIPTASMFGPNLLAQDLAWAAASMGVSAARPAEGNPISTKAAARAAGSRNLIMRRFYAQDVARGFPGGRHDPDRQCLHRVAGGHVPTPAILPGYRQPAKATQDH